MSGDKTGSERIFITGEDDFEEKVLAASHDLPVMVDFWAEWCPPCLALAPPLERLIGEYGAFVRLGKVEVDDHMRLAGRYQLRGFPTVILFWKGEERARFSGARAYHWLQRFLLEHYPPELPSPAPVSGQPRQGG